MSDTRRVRDLELLDALDSLPRIQLDNTVWRSVRQGRDPLLCRPSQGRWDLGHFDVLYTADQADGAIAEMYFHLSRQPVFPSKVTFTVSELKVRTSETLEFADLTDLEPLGVATERYSSVLYQRTQEIGDAAAFLGFDGLIAPSARWDCRNLVIFCENLSADALALRSTSPVDWNDWRKRHGKL